MTICVDTTLAEVNQLKGDVITSIKKGNWSRLLSLERLNACKDRTGVEMGGVCATAVKSLGKIGQMCKVKKIHLLNMQ